MTPDEVKILKQRLTPEWFINHTEIFQADPGWPDPVTAKIIADRFKEYWNVWMRDDVEAIFKTLAVANLCVRCKGTGKLICPGCDGCEPNHNCAACDGMGEVPCLSCGESGFTKE